MPSRKRNSGNPNYPKGGRSTVRQITRNQHTRTIAKNARYHRDDAVAWSEKQDWDKLRDEFGTLLTISSGAKKFTYKTIEEFAEYKCDGDEDVERWIVKSICPIPKKEIPWQGDWVLERTVDYARDLTLAETLITKLRSDLGVMQIAVPVAASYRKFREIPDAMLANLQKFLGGSVIEKKPKVWKSSDHKKKWMSRQSRRMIVYNKWIQTIFDFKARIDNQYLRAVGFDKPNITNLMQAVILKPGEADVSALRQANSANLTRSLMALETEKAKIFDVPLPASYQTLLDAEADSIDIEANRVADEEEHKHKKGK